MANEKKTIDNLTLRQVAEKVAQTMSDDLDDLSGHSRQEMATLIHELRVHQIELKMQNEELRRIQEELEKTRDRLSHLYDFAPVGYFTISDTGIVTAANLTAAALLGHQRSSLIGQPFSGFVLRANQDLFYLHRKKLVETQRPQSCRLWLVKQDGVKLFAKLECVVVEEGDDHSQRIRVVVSDITQQKELEDQLQQSQKMEAIGTLAGGIAHDFNNILAAIIGFAELACDDVQAGSELADHLKEILIGGKRAKLLVQQILTVSRKAPRKIVPIRLDTLMQEAVGLIRSTLPANIEIDVDLKSALDPYVMGDETQLHQIVLNLCNNAAQAMKINGGKLAIVIDTITPASDGQGPLLDCPPGAYVKLQVSDTGVGMPSEIVERIFEPYFTTRKMGQGTGMGLAVVDGIVKAHKGHIEVLSRPQRGTVFSVYLPRIEPSGEALGRLSPAPLPKGSEHILVVDDESTIVKLIKMTLERLGYTVSACSNSTEALASFRLAPERFDLVITDMSMPDLTGDKLATELFRIRPDIPIVLCTGYSNRISATSAAEIGIKAFMDKPVSTSALAKTVRKVLDEAGQR